MPKGNKGPGGYLILVGTLWISDVTIASYYAPNTNQMPLVKQLLRMVHNYLVGTMVLCGGSNLFLFTSLERSTTSSETTEGPSSSCILVSTYDYSDLLCEDHHIKKDCTFCSHPHASSFRIDHISVPLTLLPSVVDTETVLIS